MELREMVKPLCEEGSVDRGADYRPKGPWFESLAWKLSPRVGRVASFL